MIYSAIVDSMCPDIEEEVSVVVTGHGLTCFASYLPFPLEVGGLIKQHCYPWSLMNISSERFLPIKNPR